MLLNELIKDRILFFDGAMGTMLQQRGISPGEEPSLWNLTHPEVIEDIHTAYLSAGCDVVTTNTFGANGVKLESRGVSTEQVTAAAVAIARRAVGRAGRGFVALDIGPTGKLLRPMGDLPFEAAVEAFAREARASEGADLVLIETISDLYEAKAAVLAVKENCDLPVAVTLILDKSGKLLTGGDIPAAVALLEGLGVDAIGFNCGLGPEQMEALLPELRRWTGLPIMIQPNAGLPQRLDGRDRFNVLPEQFGEAMKRLAGGGAAVLGGCCGTTPAHIAAMTAGCRGIRPLPAERKERTWVSSYSRTVVFGGKPVLIGERINPTGKSRLKQALREKDVDYLLREAVSQQQNGAHILDVNVGLPEIDEAEMLSRIIPELQGVVDLPLQIDTADPDAMGRAMRLYNGKPLVNSVSGKEESMAAVFPLVKKYGGAVIALTLDEKGIPDTAEGRFAIAERIVERAGEFGIGREALIFDPLAMTISAGQQSARLALDTLSRIKDELGCATSMGVSNISFGLPAREIVNAAFFTMAMERGLSAAIINPGSKAMMDAWYACCALSGADENCAGYIAAHAGASAAPAPAAGGGMVLGQAVSRGLKESAVAAAAEALKATSPLELVDSVLIPALDEVGKGFEAGTLFLPQLLMSAEAAKAVFEKVRAAMPAGSGRSRGRVILATVQGDVHDIGKNIVKVVMENYGYEVIDLGKDVPPEEIAGAAADMGIALVGLSALMTTTVPSMEKTIRLLRERRPDCRIMVGGAVLTEGYAKTIGADFYGRDAMSSVRYAETVFQK